MDAPVAIRRETVHAGAAVPMNGPITLLVADDHATRLGIRMALAEEMQICAEADNAEQAIRAAKAEQPDVCLIGRELPGDGLGAVRAICRAAPATAVVLLAAVRDVDEMLEAVRGGAMGYVPGPLDADRLLRIIHAVARREAVMPRSLVMDLMLELRGGAAESDLLTGRETEVLGMLRRGQSTRAIAVRLGIAPSTVRRHISELVHKLGVVDRRELTSVRRGVLSGQPPSSSPGELFNNP
jgi:DNA-binding NarL/FixJ family response regulator